MNKITGLAAAISLAASVVGCSSSSSTDSTSSIQTGTFLDSAVGNIAFRTESQSGFTNADGEFTYQAGETVTFSIGGIDLPSVTAASVITPLTLVGTLDTSDTAVENISRLLQTLDSDDNPENGISIDGTAHDTAELITGIDFSGSDFDTAVANLIANSGSSRTELVSVSDAIAHLESTIEATISSETISFSQNIYSGVSFSVSIVDSDITTLSFNENGTGSIKFSPNEDNDFDDNDVNTLSSWSFINGRLSFKEVPDDGDDFWDWIVTPTGFSDGVLTFSVSVSGMEDGESVGFSSTGSMQFSATIVAETPAEEEEEEQEVEEEEAEEEAATSDEEDLNLVGSWTVTEAYSSCDYSPAVHYSTVTFSLDNQLLNFSQDFIEDIAVDSPCYAIDNDDDSENSNSAHTGDGSFTASEIFTYLDDDELQSITIDNDNQFTAIVVFGTTTVRQVWTRVQ